MLQRKEPYADIPFFLSMNPFTNDFNLVKELSAIRQSVKNIIMTNKGERYFNDYFGCDIYGSLFENFDYTMVISLQSRIANNLELYEPRIVVNDVRILDDPENNSLNIIVDIGVKYTNLLDTVQISLSRNR